MTTRLDHIAGSAAARVSPERYEALRGAILRVLPREGDGLTRGELGDRVAPLLSEGLFPHLGSIRWYIKAVQLDLEARGLIERLPGSKPLRLRHAR